MSDTLESIVEEIKEGLVPELQGIAATEESLASVVDTLTDMTSRVLEVLYEDRFINQPPQDLLLALHWYLHGEHTAAKRACAPGARGVRSSGS